MVLLRALLLLFLFLGGSALACSDEPDLALFVTDNPDPVKCNEEVVYTVVVENRAPTTKTSLEVAFYMLDEDFEFVEATSDDGWTCSYNLTELVVICNKDSMEPGESNVINITFRARGAEDKTVAAYVRFSSLEKCDCDYVETCESTQVECSLCDTFSVELTGTPPEKVGDEFEVLLQIENLVDWDDRRRYISFDVYWSPNISFIEKENSIACISCDTYDDHIHCCAEACSWELLRLLLRFRLDSYGGGYVQLKNFIVSECGCEDGVYCPNLTAGIEIGGELKVILDPWGDTPNPMEEYIRVVDESREVDY